MLGVPLSCVSCLGASIPPTDTGIGRTRPKLHRPPQSPQAAAVAAAADSKNDQVGVLADSIYSAPSTDGGWLCDITNHTGGTSKHAADVCSCEGRASNIAARQAALGASRQTADAMLEQTSEAVAAATDAFIAANSTQGASSHV